jgi:hypothetical protein
VLEVLLLTQFSPRPTGAPEFCLLNSDYFPQDSYDPPKPIEKIPVSIVMNEVITLLSSTCSEINELETEAKRLLYELGDTPGYHRLLRHKAILLSELADAVEELDAAPHPLHALVQERVGGFSFEADRALRLDSVFYMAVLLYPEEQHEGCGNDLEVLINHLKEHCGEHA